jgi:glycosyltransferase involved in cell wall biosynthesis
LNTSLVVFGAHKGEAVKIYVFIDVYPHPFKPYFDVQFEEWQKAGHVVRIFSLSRISGAVSPITVETLKTLREAPFEVSLKIILALIQSPLRMSTIFSTGRSLLGKVKLLAIDCQLPRELPDLFFVHNLAAAVRFAYLKHIFPDIPFALYYHGGEIPGVPSVREDQAKFALMAPDIVFSNTKYSMDDAVRRGAVAPRVKRIPVGFRLEDYLPSIPRGYLENDCVQLISVGRVAPEKGFDIAILALAELHKKAQIAHLEFKYTLVGNGPETQNIRRLAQECGIAGSVNFVGQLSKEEVIAHLAKADVLLVPSVPGNTWEENQACVMQEAMLMGVVVVASDIGGVSESIPSEMRKFLFTAGNYHQLAENVCQLVSVGSDNIRRLGSIGRQFVVENYNVRVLNERLLRMARQEI